MLKSGQDDQTSPGGDMAGQMATLGGCPGRIFAETGLGRPKPGREVSEEADYEVRSRRPNPSQIPNACLNVTRSPGDLRFLKGLNTCEGAARAAPRVCGTCLMSLNAGREGAREATRPRDRPGCPVSGLTAATQGSLESVTSNAGAGALKLGAGSRGGNSAPGARRSSLELELRT